MATEDEKARVIQASPSARYLLRVLAGGPRNLYEWRESMRARVDVAADELISLGLVLRSPDNILGVTRRGHRAQAVLAELPADELGMTAEEVRVLWRMHDGHVDSVWTDDMTAHGLVSAGAVTISGVVGVGASPVVGRPTPYHAYVHVTARGRELIECFAEDFQVYTALRFMDD